MYNSKGAGYRKSSKMLWLLIMGYKFPLMVPYQFNQPKHVSVQYSIPVFVGSMGAWAPINIFNRTMLTQKILILPPMIPSDFK